MTINQISKFRTNLGMTQRVLAKKLGRDTSFVSKLENGRRKLTPEIQEKLKLIFKVK